VLRILNHRPLSGRYGAVKLSDEISPAKEKMDWTRYKEKVKSISERLVEAQRPIRILDAIKWDPSVETDFFSRKACELPRIDSEYYKKIALGFDPQKKHDEFEEILNEIRLQLGPDDDLGHLLSTMASEYQDVVKMLAARGSKTFWETSRKLYGSPKDKFFEDSNTVLELGRLLHSILSNLEGKSLGQEYPKVIPAEEAVQTLNGRFQNSFLKGRIRVEISDGIVADAAAGSDVIKLKQGAMFSTKDIDIFEVHEGWVHVATTANGGCQKVAKWLAKGPPRCAATQEGLAVLMEIFTFSSYPRRAQAVNNRILGIDKAEDGADFLEVYGFYLSEGYDEADSFRNSVRVFRGGVITGGAPFTKDISYCRGFIENYNFIRTAIRKGRPELVPFLYAGKLHVDDVPLLYSKFLEGVVDAPVFLPPHFSDLNGLAVWMSFSNFLNAVDLNRVQDYYDGLFKKFL
jgi:uncharacterized protein (TIGR02421 family)